MNRREIASVTSVPPLSFTQEPNLSSHPCTRTPFVLCVTLKMYKYGTMIPLGLPSSSSQKPDPNIEEVFVSAVMILSPSQYLEKIREKNAAGPFKSQNDLLRPKSKKFKVYAGLLGEVCSS